MRAVEKDTSRGRYDVLSREHALKKLTSDPSDTKNYQTISNLTFILELLECCAYDNLVLYTCSSTLCYLSSS